MVVLGVVEGGSGGDFGGDGSFACRGQVPLVGLPGVLGQPALLLGGPENHRPVLGTPVVSLAHPLGGVVLLPENLQQINVGKHRRVVDDQGRLGVGGAARAHLPVGGMGRMPPLVADGGGEHPRRPPEQALHPPEAPHPHIGLLHAVGERRDDGAAVYEVRLRLQYGMVAARRGVGGGRQNPLAAVAGEHFHLPCLSADQFSATGPETPPAARTAGKVCCSANLI